MTDPVLPFDLLAELAALEQEHGWRNAGHSAKTLVKHHQFRVVLVALAKAKRMDTHTAEGAISIQSIKGLVRVHVAGSTLELATGGLLALAPGLAHDVEAVEDSAFVLSVSTAK